MSRPSSDATTAPPGSQVADRLQRVQTMLTTSARAVDRGTGVTHAQLELLRTLEAAGEVTIGELAGLAGTQQSTVSIVVGRLTAKQYVLRRPSSQDGRRVLLRLGARGRALLRRAPKRPVDRLVEALRRMDPAERQLLDRGLRTLERRLEAVERRRRKRARRG
ncbi:MAG: MarR family winged helix-turn-helix transcriptional regulator [Gemmatimonadales bacterium]